MGSRSAPSPSSRRSRTARGRIAWCSLPGDERGLVIDAKFPLEGFTQYREAKGDEARSRAGARVRNDILIHVKHIAEKYLIPGETQDIAIMFVPAESVYADLAEHFDDVMQKAHRARIVIVSPSLLSLAIQVMQALVRDARIREEARVIQVEVQKLLEDILRLGDRVTKLDTHFRQAQDDVAQIRTSTDKITKRGQKIEALEFDEASRAPVASFCGSRGEACGPWSSGAGACAEHVLFPRVHG